MTKRAFSGLDEVKKDLEDEGVGIAYVALKDICLDKTAPAPARATAGVAIFRAGGLLEAKKARRPDDDIASLSGDELKKLMSGWKAEAAKLEREIAARKAKPTSADETGDDDEDPFA